LQEIAISYHIHLIRELQPRVGADATALECNHIYSTFT
jgi:hypothetical protein